MPTYFLLFVLLMVAVAATHAAPEPGPELAPMVFTQRAPAAEFDTRHLWSNSILRLALEKTQEEFGPYILETAPTMSYARQWQSLKDNRFPNYFFGAPYEPELAADPDLSHVPFPVERGLLGYRVCFYPENKGPYIRELANSNRIRELSHGQGEGWADTEVLRFNGFNVVEVKNYDNLFKMTAAARFHFFCRGIAEVKAEYLRHQATKNLALDKTLAFRYQFPVFLFTHSSNQTGLKRVEMGLKKAFSDGTLRTLSQAHYSEALEFVQLEKRKIIELENPLLQGLDKSYQRYEYKLHK